MKSILIEQLEGTKSLSNAQIEEWLISGPSAEQFQWAIQRTQDILNELKSLPWPLSCDKGGDDSAAARPEDDDDKWQKRFLKLHEILLDVVHKDPALKVTDGLQC
jgi:hypothetical protein